MERVKIVNTKSVFDGKTGLVEEEDGDKITVLVDFDDVHKVRNAFPKDNVEEVNSEPEKPEIEEDLDLVTPDMDYPGEVLALAQLLDIDPAMIDEEDEYSNYKSYRIAEEDDDHGDEVWEVYDSWYKCESEAQDRVRSLIDDLGVVEAYGFDAAIDYLDEDYFDDMLREDKEYWVDEMDTEDLIEYMERYDLIDESDKIQDPDWEQDPDEPDEEPEMIYPEDLLDSKKDELVDCLVEAEGDSIEWYRNTFGDRDLEEYLKNYPEAINMESMVADYTDVTSELARYDGEEHYVKLDDGSEYYLYRYE